MDQGLFTWAASSKSHLSGDRHSLVVYAYGLRITGVPRATLIQKFRVMTATSPSGTHPQANVTAPAGYFLTGGGAQVLSNPAGNYLTLTAPHDEDPARGAVITWYAKSKDHKSTSHAQITAWGIAIGPNGDLVATGDRVHARVPIEGWGTLELRDQVDGAGTYVSGGVGSSIVPPNEGWVVSCPGGYSKWASGAGRMLMGVYPWYSGVAATSKDHLTGSVGTVHASYIELRKQP